MCIKNENGYIFCEETFGKDKENSSCPPPAEMRAASFL